MIDWQRPSGNAWRPNGDRAVRSTNEMRSHDGRSRSQKENEYFYRSQFFIERLHRCPWHLTLTFSIPLRAVRERLGLFAAMNSRR